MPTDKPLTLSVSVDEANLILTGLGELPAKHVLQIIEKIKAQAMAQIGKPAEEAESCSDGE